MKLKLIKKELFRVATGQEMKKSQEKLKLFNMVVLIPLKAGGNIQGHYDLNNIFSFNEEGIFVETFSVIIND